MSSWVIQICVLLIVSYLFGQIAKKLGQSRVVGEISAGILLGPTFLGSFSPSTNVDLFHPQSLNVIGGISELGLILLMFEVPWHATGLAGEKLKKIVPGAIALVGIGLSFCVGCMIGFFSINELAPNKPLLPYMLFFGIALSITALPVLVRIVKEHKNVGASAAAISLSAAIYTDIFAWLGLTLVLTAQLSSEQNINTGLLSFLGLLTLIITAMWLIKPLVKRYFVLQENKSYHAKLVGAIIVGCGFAQVTSWLGFHQAIGAVLAGYVFLGVSGLAENWKKSVSGFADLLLTPIFFAYSGLQVSLSFSGAPIQWLWLLILIIGGCFGKIVGSYFAGRLVGLDKSTSLEVGVLMNTKGLVELVVLGVGLQTGILSNVAYSVLLLLALVSTALTVPLINFINGTVNKSRNQYQPVERKDV